MGKSVGDRLFDLWKNFISLTKKIFLDNYAIFILIFVLLIIGAIIYHYGLSPFLAFASLIPTYGYLILKGFQEKIKFKKSETDVISNKGPKVLFWILDGCNIPAFIEVALKNPDLKILYEEGYFANCVTIFPSITPAAHSTLMTGCYPAKHRVPAFDWVEVTPKYDGTTLKEYIRVMPDFKRYTEAFSQKMARQKFFSSLGDAFNLNQKILSPMVTTIYEARKKELYTASITEWIHRGADRFISQSVSSLLEDFTNKKIIEKNSMFGLLSAIYKEVNYEYANVIWGSNYKQIDDLMVYWKSGTDTKSHEYGPDSSQLRQEIEDGISKLGESIRFYKMYSDQPLYIIISSDHSQSKVTHYSDLPTEFKQTLGNSYKIAGQEDKAKTAILKEAEIIFANNDRAALIYIFGSPERKDEAENDTLEFLKKRPDVDLILYKKDGIFQVIQVLRDGSCSSPENIATFFKDKDGSYPNAVERLEGLMTGDKWGDIVISMKEGYSMNSEFKPSQPGEEILHGDHGGLNSSDSLVPLLFWGPTIKPNPKNQPFKTFRTVDIAPTIATIFNDKHPKTDGRSLDEIFIGAKQTTISEFSSTE